MRNPSTHPLARAALRIAPLLVLLAGATPGALTAQEPDTAGAAAVLPDAQEPVRMEGGVPSPGGVLLRALLVPGWGHASIGEHTRGGFYFVTESASVWMVFRTLRRLRAARAVRDLWESEVALTLEAEGITDPAEVAAVQDDDPRVADARSLVEARSQQFEDWLALGIFLVFLGGIDAFVSAHLMDFPEPVGLELGPGRLGIAISLPAGALLPR